MKKHFLIRSFGLLLLSIFLHSCNSSGTGIDQTGDAAEHDDVIEITTEQFAAAEMSLGKIEQQAISRVIKANGYVDVPPELRASVSVKLGGFVKNLSILPGDKVSKGAILFTLENPEFIQLQQDYLESKAQLSYLQSDYERQKSLAGENIASQKNFHKAESDYLTTLARNRGLKEKLKLLNVNTQKLEDGDIESTIHVYATISGFVSKVNINLGKYISPHDVAVEIVNTEHLHVELQVYEKDILDIIKGQQLTFIVPGSGTNKFEGEVYLVGKTISEDTRTINIHGHIDEAPEVAKLLPGMYVDAAIEVSSSSRNVLPNEAIVSNGDEYFVLIQVSKDSTGYTFEKREIEKGESNSQWTEIRNASDFGSNTIFLVKGAFNLIRDQGEGHSH